MARKAIVLAACCGVFFTASFACRAQTFGDIRAGKQTPNLTQPAEDPAIDKWMRTAPAGEAERNDADAGLSADLSKSALMFDGNPIGGEIWSNHAATPGSASSAPAAVSSQVRRLIDKQNKPAADKEDERKKLSRSPRSLNDAATPQSASSSAPAASSRVQTRSNEQNKPEADSVASIVAGRSASAPAQGQDLSRSPPSLEDPPQSASSSPAAMSHVQRPINEPNKPAADSAASIVAGRSASAPAQPAAIDVTTPAPQGISDKETRFGIVAPFSGSAKELGRQMKIGIETVFSLVNDTGGINGRQLKLFSADDGYEPSRTGAAMQQLWEGDHIFGIVGNVGTPTAVVALPFALEHKMLFFGAFTGANLLRQVPPDHYVFNYRASYSEETEAAVRYLVRVRGLQPNEIAVFAQQDSYGDAGYDGVAKAVRALRGGYAEPVLRLNYKRNTVDVTDAVAQLQSHKASIKAVVMVATYRAAANFIVKTRDRYPHMIYTNVSFVGSTALSEELVLQGERFADGVIVTQVVPAVSGYSRAVLDYKTALAKYFPGERPDYVSFEGYLVAKILVEGLRRVGPELDTEKLIDTLEGIHDLDMGLGTLLNFSPSEHQASHMVWGTQLDKTGHFNAIDLEADQGRAADKQQAGNVEVRSESVINLPKPGASRTHRTQRSQRSSR